MGVVTPIVMYLRPIMASPYVAGFTHAGRVRLSAQGLKGSPTRFEGFSSDDDFSGIYDSFPEVAS